DEIAEPVGDEVDQTLRRGADFFTGALVSVDLSAHEEEVVADAVQNDSEIQQRHHWPHCSHAEGEIPQSPGSHTDEHDHLDAQSSQCYRQQEHEQNLGHLAKSLNESRIGRPDFIQERVGESVVELKRNAEQKRAGDENEEVAVAQQREGIETERVMHAELTACVGWRSM